MRRYILGGIASVMVALMLVTSARADTPLDGGGTGRVTSGLGFAWSGYAQTHVVRSPNYWKAIAKLTYSSSSGRSCVKTDHKFATDDYIEVSCNITSSAGDALVVTNNGKWERSGITREESTTFEGVRW